MVREKALAKDYKPFLICFREYIMTDNLSQAQMLSSLSVVSNFETPLTAAHQGSLSFTVSWSLLRLMSIESVMPSNHLILCCPFSSCPQSFPALGSFPMSWLFTSGGQSIGASALSHEHNENQWRNSRIVNGLDK